MSDSLACAPARESAALQWLAEHDPEDGHGLVGEQAHDPASMFTREVVLAAFYAGANCADDEFAIDRTTGQAQLDDATALMTEAAELLRGYEKHHRDEAFRLHSGTDQHRDRMAKAERNALQASRLEAWLRGDRLFPITVDGSYVAHAEFRAPQVNQAVDLPGVVDREQAGRLAEHMRKGARGGFVAGGYSPEPPLRPGEVAARLSPPVRVDTADDTTTFRVQTGDPRFDPAHPVLINGYRFLPATTHMKD